jgi:hypothetical protein
LGTPPASGFGNVVAARKNPALSAPAASIAQNRPNPCRFVNFMELFLM